MQIRVNDKLQRSLIKTYWRKARRSLAKTTAPMIELSREIPPEALRMMIGGMKSNEYIRTLIIELWGNVGSRFAGDMDRSLSRKAQQDYDWSEMFRNYAEDAANAKANSILGTQMDEARRIINLVENEGIREGWSIDRIQKEITARLSRELPQLQSWHAERIARTEVIGASNKGSFDSAMRSGLQIQKGWLTSGLKGVRDSHLFYESLGYVPMDYSYNTGLKFPGDPTGAREEIINCRCTIVYDVD